MIKYLRILFAFVFTFAFSNLLFSIEPTTFAVIGDFGNGSDNETLVANLVKSWNSEFVVTTGDDRYGATTFDLTVGRDYCNFLAGAQSGGFCNGNGSTTNAFFPSAGNHEYTDGGGINEYLNYFNLPGTGVQSSGTSGSELYYDFVQGPIHFFVIDSYTNTEVQKTWLQIQMAASTSIWNIVYFHHPPYTSGDHGPTTYMQWPFAEWGADAVLNGHDHTYERIMQDGIVYFVNGLGGMSKYGFLSTTEPGSAIRYNAEYGAQKVVADDISMTFSFINVLGETIDEYTIYKTSPPTVSLLSPLNNTHFEIPHTITISADAIGTDGTIVKVEFFANGTSIGINNTSPYSIDWTIPVNGAYSIIAKATDNLGTFTVSTPVEITVGEFNRTVISQISSGNDDVEESSVGNMYLTSTDIELVNDSYQSAGDQTVGLRFTGLGIPQGAFITNAFIQFTVDETVINTATDLQIFGHYIDDSPSFSSLAFDVSGRNKTTASVNWVPPVWNIADVSGVEQQTPDLSAVVQEIVNRPGFSPSSTVSFIITGTGTRTAEAYEGVASAAAALHIEYTNIQNDPPAFVSNPISKPSATEDTDYSSTIAGSATDPDGDVLTFSKTNGPGWLTISPDGTIAGTPVNANVGINIWTIQVSDGKGGTDLASLQITVVNVNDAPTFSSETINLSDALIDVGYSGSIADEAMDIDVGDVLSFYLVSGPVWLTISPEGVLSGTSGIDNIGTNLWTIEVRDGKGGTDRASLEITVIDPSNVTYCASHGNATDEWVAKIDIGVQVKSSGSSNATGYEDLTKLTAFSLVSGSTNSLTLQPGFSSRSKSEYWSVWIDYNLNGNFNDPGEMVFTATRMKSSVSGTITIPVMSSIETTMRVSMSRSGTPSSCEIFLLGEVEDYTVVISGTDPQPSIADFSANSTSIEAGGSVRFTDLSTNNPTTLLWSFPGGTPSSSTEQNPSVTYGSAGVFNVTLTASYSEGSVQQELKVNYITVTAPSIDPPIAEFSANATTVFVGDPVQFTDLSTYATNWNWDFGDTQTSTEQHPVHTYVSAGNYSVTLTATNANGSDVLTKFNYITVENPPASNYCEPVIDNSSEWIVSININGQTNNTGQNSDGYTFFTDPVFELEAGTSYSFELVPFNTKNRNFWRIWLDVSGNSDFIEAGETLYAGNNKRGTVTGTIIIPSNTEVSTRIRIAMKSGSSPAPCDAFNGEMQDYLVNITQPYIKSATIATSADMVETCNETLLRVYPNPFNNEINISIDGSDNYEMAFVQILDISGRLMYVGEYGNQRKITIRDLQLNAGMYFIKIQVGDFIKTEQLIKTH